MMSSDSHNVVHMPSTQVCIKHSEMSGRTSARLVMRARPKLILHEITNNYNTLLLLADPVQMQS